MDDTAIRLTARDLVPFCATDPSRPHLSVPWSQDQFTFASNGHILVRVARLPDVGDGYEDELYRHPPIKMIARIFESAAAQRVTPLPAIPGSPLVINCSNCGGDPKGKRKCPSCEGRGSFPSLKVRGDLFDPRYIKLITKLPGLKFSAKPPGYEARFVFTGGEGVLMPMRGVEMREAAE